MRGREASERPREREMRDQADRDIRRSLRPVDPRRDGRFFDRQEVFMGLGTEDSLEDEVGLGVGEGREHSLFRLLQARIGL